MDGVAYHTGRFAAPSEMAVFSTPFDSKAKKVGEDRKKGKSASEGAQMRLFEEESEGDAYSDLGY